MRDQVYETQILTPANCTQFKQWFESSIGTQIETTEHGVDEVSLTCFDLTSSEVKQCREFENSLLHSKQELKLAGADNA